MPGYCSGMSRTDGETRIEQGDRQLHPAEQGAPGAETPRETSMLPGRRARPPLESALVRTIATGGVIGIGVALGAILVSQDVEGWIVGLVVAVVSVGLSAILWSSRRL